MNLKDMVLLLSLCGNNSSPNPDVNLTGYATEKWVTEGFSPKGTAATAVSQHNTADDSHNDIRLELQAINDRLTAFFDSDNQTLDELSEIVAYITSNKTLIDSITTSKVNVTDIINNLATNVSNKPLSAAQGVVLKGLVDSLTSGKLDTSALPTAINTALAQAKESGEFDGPKGDSVGIKSINESTESGGSSRIMFTDGHALAIRNGIDGHDPVRGVDYYTDADKAEFSEYIATELAKRGQLKPEFANSIEECTDTTKLYVLPDGYIYAYTFEVTEGGTKPNFTNQLPISTDTDGSIYGGDYNGDGKHDGYKADTYLSSGNPGTRAGVECTGFIPFDGSGNYVIYLSGITAKTTESNFRFAFYNASKTYIAQVNNTQLDSNSFAPIGYETGSDGNITKLDCGAFIAATSRDPAFFRLCAPEIDSSSIITVNQPITYTTTEGGKVYEWKNTGHAFVPADYENRILALETENERLKADVESLKNADSSGSVPGNTETVPTKVVTEATALVDKALSRSGNRVLRFLISSDAHQKNDHTLITKGTKELGQAHGEVLKQIGVDFVASLGDVSWGSSSSDNATVAEECRAYNRMMLDHIRGQNQIWTEGNHETDMLTESQIHGFIYSHNKGLVQNADQWIDGYGYMDFENQKVRVICLNTDQATGSDSSGVSDAQLKWFAETALNMEGKTDWSVITMGHHPLGYNNVTLFKNCASVVEAFIGKQNFAFTTNGGTSLAIDYSNKSCQYVAHFHGHAHAYSVVKIQKYVSSGVYEELDAWEICVPNACYERNNQYLNNGQYTQRYSTATTYSKSNEDGKRTSFNLVTVCLDGKTIYADNYGAGIDREISY